MALAASSLVALTVMKMPTATNQTAARLLLTPPVMAVLVAMAMVAPERKRPKILAVRRLLLVHSCRCWGFWVYVDDADANGPEEAL